MLRALSFVALVAVASLGCRGKELGRISLAGKPAAGFAGEGSYAAGTKRIHLFYDAAWIDYRNLPDGTLELALERDGRVVASTTCPTAPDGPGICGHTGGGKELGSKRQDCERPLTCKLDAPTADGGTLRARLTFREPEKLREIYRMEVVLRE